MTIFVYNVDIGMFVDQVLYNFAKPCSERIQIDYFVDRMITVAYQIVSKYIQMLMILLFCTVRTMSDLS